MKPITNLPRINKLRFPVIDNKHAKHVTTSVKIIACLSEKKLNRYYAK